MSNPYDSPQPPDPRQQYQPPQQSGFSPQQPPQQTDPKAIASLILGVVGLLAWCCPLVGVAVTGTGLYLGITSMNSPSRVLAIVGVVLCTLGMLASVGNGILGAVLRLSAM